MSLYDGRALNLVMITREALPEVMRVLARQLNVSLSSATLNEVAAMSVYI
jgi:hypothetical protein